MTGHAAQGRAEDEQAATDPGALDALTAELVALLGSPDPGLREDLAAAVVRAWVRQGWYDPPRLAALGALLCAGLTHGLGERGTDTVLRRGASAALLAEVVAAAGRQGADPALVRGLRAGALSWARGERDLRGRVPGRGAVTVAARGADLLLALAESPQLGVRDLPALLEAVVGLLATPGLDALLHREDEHLARAALAVLRRGGVGADLLRAVLAPVLALAGARPGHPEWSAHVNSLGWLRLLHLWLLTDADGTTGPGAYQPVRSAPPMADLLQVLGEAIGAYEAGRGGAP